MGVEHIFSRIRVKFLLRVLYAYIKEIFVWVLSTYSSKLKVIFLLRVLYAQIKEIFVWVLSTYSQELKVIFLLMALYAQIKEIFVWVLSTYSLVLQWAGLIYSWCREIILNYYHCTGGAGLTLLSVPPFSQPLLVHLSIYLSIQSSI